MRWLKERRRLHIRTLNGHVFTVTERPTVDLKAIMADMTAAMSGSGGEGVACFVGTEGVAWIRTNQIESVWISP